MIENVLQLYLLHIIFQLKWMKSTLVDIVNKNCMNWWSHI